MVTPRRKRSALPPVPVAAVSGVSLESVLESLAGVGRSLDEEFIRSVYDFSAEMHSDQKRRSGEPYLTHPLYVAWLLAEWGFDQVSVAVGLLHDVLEDTLSTRQTLAERFGEEVEALVDGVTKIGQHAYVRRDDAQAETFRKLILASVRDVRVILVKLADRLHNMMTLEHMNRDSQRRIAQETLEIYAPIAHRLGMAKVQADLEDLSFYYLRPDRYQELDLKVKEKLKGAKGEIQKLGKRLETELGTAAVEASITFRVKRLYSIHQKLLRQGIEIAQLYDYLAFRVVTEDIKDCYATLGVVHQAWRPVPGRFKDYIAMPKGNFYQSLHTTLLAEGGQPFEVQIRTREMDQIAEEGIAAHWRYKQRAGESDDAGKIAWLRQVLDWQKEVDDPRSFLTALKLDLYPDEVYTFTPKGEVLAFPRGAMPLDFAYRIHTELGHHCSGARVNGKLVPLRTELQTGDRIEIMTNANRHPSRDWLRLVKTSRAKSKIRHWLNTEQKKRAGEIGRRLLERALRKHKVSPKKIFDSKRVQSYLEKEGIATLGDLFSRVGFGRIQPAQVVPRLLSEEQLSTTGAPPSRLRSAVTRMLPFGGDAAISVRGEGDMLAYLAKCCRPLPGEEVVGYITRGRGVSVHSAECPNVKNLLYDPAREIEVSWGRPGDAVYAIQLEIATEDEPGMLARLTETMSKLGSNIKQINASTLQPGRGLIDVVVEVKNRRHFEKLRQAIQGLPGVHDVSRRMGSS
jgi:GTP pyrophosphokinase